MGLSLLRARGSLLYLSAPHHCSDPHLRSAQKLQALIDEGGVGVGNGVAVWRQGPAPDRELLRNEIVQTQLLNTFREAFALGPSGAAWEQHLLVGDWGFSLDELRIPVTVWQGSLDRNVPPEMGRSLASSIPGARLRLLDGEGHLSLVHNHFEEVLRDLVLPL